MLCFLMNSVMFSNTLILIILFWYIKTTYQADFIVLRANNLIKRNIVKRNAATDVPKIREFIVKTTVANRFAETSVVSKIENVDTYPQQTTFSVVLPERAFASGFSMEIDGKTYKAFVKEKEEAKKIYGQSVTSGQTAAHIAVSTRNSNRFTVNVNVEPESKVNFQLTYEELLQREKGHYEVIANIQPGQIVKKLLVEVQIKESRPLLFVRTPSLRSGNVIVQNNNATQLDPHATVKISNTSAEVKFSPDINRQLQFACAGLGNSEYDGFAGQFVVQYDVERDPQGCETLFQDEYFVTFFAPPNLDPIPKHIVFVLDTSGSMDGTKISQLKEAMMNILPLLYSEDLFSIVQYETTIHLWDLNMRSYDVIPRNPIYGNLARQLQQRVIPEAVLATPDNIEIAKKIVNKFIAKGGTNAIGGLEVGLYLIKLVQQQYQGQHKPILVFLTDGLPSSGISDTSQIISLYTVLRNKGSHKNICSKYFDTTYIAILFLIFITKIC